jgi:hypothetical protein
VNDWLYAAGPGAVDLRDAGLQRLRDGDFIRKGFAEQRIVPAFDLDFGEILAGLLKWLVPQEWPQRSKWVGPQGSLVGLLRDKQNYVRPRWIALGDAATLFTVTEVQSRSTMGINEPQPTR